MHRTASPTRADRRRFASASAFASALPLRRAAAAIVAALSLATGAGAETDADRWNLADLYADAAALKADVERARAQSADFAACAGRLGDGVAVFKRCMDLRADLDKRLTRIAVYAFQRYAGDTGAAEGQELRQQFDLLRAQVQEAGAWLDPEVLRLGAARIDAYLAADRSLAIYRRPLEEILRAAPHTLDAAGEAMLARIGLMSGAGSDTYSILTNADLPWPTIRLSTGESVRLDAAGYTKYRAAPDAGDRQRVMDAFFGAYKIYERTFGTTLYAQLKEDAVQATLRRYPDSISRALDGDRMPVAVIDTLIAETNASLPTLHRYLRLRAQLLGLQTLRYSDIYPPLVRGDAPIPLAEAERWTLEAVAPLGPDYVAAMKRGFASRWMDAYPRPNKLSGAHMSGGAYDVHPYVMLNYNDDYESASTLAHEWGHAMHSVLTTAAQPFVTSNYATFVAEIASTFNERLLLDRMLKAAKTDDERLLYLGSALENLRGTFYRQAMFAEFERRIHARADAGEPLSGEALTKTYCELLDRYHGTRQGVMAIDPAYCIEWAYIPHFYRGFYVYQYATSIAASSLFADRVQRGEPGARDRYLALLKAGSSDDPYRLVKAAGVDLASPEPYRALVAEMNRIMDEMERILARR